MDHAALVALLVLASSCMIGDDPDAPDEEVGVIEAKGRHRVIADVDEGGGVYLANRPGGYYMGRLMVGWQFQREGAWYTSDANHSSYAWGVAFGHSGGTCLWIGPSRGQSNATAGTWASPAANGNARQCPDAWSDRMRSGAYIMSHSNCPEPSDASNGTEKKLLTDAAFYWNIDWNGGYEGGELRDLAGVIPAGTHVWYRYTTRDGKAIVAFVPGVGWGFFNIGVLDRARTGTWSKPTDPATLYPC